MAEPKTKVTNASVKDFLNSLSNETKKKDSFRLLEIFEDIAGEKAKMWGPSIIGCGVYHYKSERSAQEGDWPLIGFSPRKASLTLYLLLELESNKNLLPKLGVFKTTKVCLYINKLSDVDEAVLKKLIANTLKEMKQRYPTR
jgi:hypothetical protein